MGRKIEAIFGKNIGLKLLSLSLALLLKAYFYSPDNFIVDVVPATIQFRNIPKNRIIISPSRPERGVPAQLEIRGPRPLVEQVRTSNAKIPIFLPPQVSDKFSGIVDSQQVQLPSGVEILSVRPAKVSITTEQLVGKQVIVELNTKGEIPEGFKLDSVELFPSTVVVRGPKSRVEKIESVKSRSLDLSGFSASRRVDISLSPPGNLIVLGVNVVSASLKISAVVVKKELPAVMPKVNVPQGFSTKLEPQQVTVVVEGASQKLNDIESIQLAEIDLSKKGVGRHAVDLQAVAPEGVTVIETRPKKIQVNLVKKNE